MYYVVYNELESRIYTHMDNVKEDEKEGFKLFGEKETLKEAIELAKTLQLPIGKRNIQPK